MPEKRPWWSSGTHQSADRGSQTVGRDNSGHMNITSPTTTQSNSFNANISTGYGVKDVHQFIAEREQAIKADYDSWAQDVRAQYDELAGRLSAAITDYSALSDEHERALAQLARRETRRRLDTGMLLGGAGSLLLIGLLLGVAIMSLGSGRSDAGGESVSARPATTMTASRGAVPDASAAAGGAPGSRLSEVPGDYLAAVVAGDAERTAELLSPAFLGPEPDAKLADVLQFWSGYSSASLFAEPRLMGPSLTGSTWVAVPVAFSPADGSAPIFEWVYWAIDSESRIEATGGSGGTCTLEQLGTCEPEGQPRDG